MDIEVCRRRLIARILAVNDTCADEKHRLAMRSVIMSSVNEVFGEIQNAFGNKQTSTGPRTGRHKP